MMSLYVSCVQWASRVRWLKQYEASQIDQVTYTELCNKQNETTCHTP